MRNKLYDRMKNSRIDSDTLVSVVCVILAISVLAVPAAAQFEGTFTDDFEDQSTNGWENPDETAITISSDSVNGEYSLRSRTGQDSTGVTTWESGPQLQLNEDFRIEATAKPEFVDTPEEGYQIRYGISSGSPGQEGENAFVIYDAFNSETYLGTYDGDSPTQDAIQNSYDGEWTNFVIESDAGSSEVTAKVWGENETEPSQPQLSRNFTDVESGNFTISTGGGTAGSVPLRYAYLDDISITGTAGEDPDATLRLDTGNYLGFGETQSYEVYDLVGENDIRQDVTSEATVTSGNTSVITVDQSNNELTATTDENVSTRVNITATYDGRTDVRQVTVATQSVENLEVLPFLGRAGAMFLDRGFQMILASLLMSIAATRVGGVYAGLGVYQMGLTAGWLIGWVPIGLAFVGLFTTLFIGLNIAANIDYSVRR